MGQDGVDTDLPTQFELLCLNNVLGKIFFSYVSCFIWLSPSFLTVTTPFFFLVCFRTFQIVFYALRPTFVRSQRLTRWHLLNILAQLIFDFALVTTFGTRPLVYLLMSSFFAGSLHPCAGHFIAEHYLWDGMEQETYSYYGPLNVLAYNVSCIWIVMYYYNDSQCPRLDIIMNITTFPLYHGHGYLPSEP